MNKTPLAKRIRPQNLNDFLGQDNIIGKGTLLRKAIQKDEIPSIIFWGPPGVGKTTLGFIIAKTTSSDFLKLSATNSGLKDLRNIIKKAEANYRLQIRTILFIDEIHRWNKIQQDSLLPHIENGVITLIGATTENPSFEVRSALLSRCRVFVLKKLQENHIKKILQKALNDKINGLGKIKISIKEECIDLISKMSMGDARCALNILEYASSINKNITKEVIKQAFQKSHLLYDKDSDQHFNLISAFHKSMRGSNINATLYYLARMLEAGEDPLYIARRIVRFASEDIGLANSRALEQSVAAYQACHFIGMPECNVILTQAAVYMAKCKKSNNLYTAYTKAKKDVENLGALEVPLHLRNAPTKLMQKLDYGKDYKYSPNYNYEEDQEYMPKKLIGKDYFND